MLKITNQILITICIILFSVGCNVQTLQKSNDHEIVELSKVEELILNSTVDRSGDILFHDGEVYSLKDKTARQFFEKDPDGSAPENRCHHWVTVDITTIDEIKYRVHLCTFCGDYWFENKGDRSIEEIHVEMLLNSYEPTTTENNRGDVILVTAYNPDSIWDSCVITFEQNNQGELAVDCPNGGECCWVPIGFDTLPHPSNGDLCKYEIYKCSKCSGKYYRKIEIIE